MIYSFGGGDQRTGAALTVEPFSIMRFTLPMFGSMPVSAQMKASRFGYPILTGENSTRFPLEETPPYLRPLLLGQC